MLNIILGNTTQMTQAYEFFSHFAHRDLLQTTQGPNHQISEFGTDESNGRIINDYLQVRLV